jgi:hypothetical protein
MKFFEKKYSSVVAREEQLIKDNDGGRKKTES